MRLAILIAALALVCGCAASASVTIRRDTPYGEVLGTLEVRP